MRKTMSYYRFWRTLGTAKGRIKRMRKNKDKGLGYWKFRTNKFVLKMKISDLVFGIIKTTRWNKH